MDGVFAAISHTWYREGEGEPTSPKSCKRKHNENDAALKPTKKFAGQGLRARGLDAGKEDDHPKEVIAFCSPTENPYGQFSHYYRSSKKRRQSPNRTFPKFNYKEFLKPIF